MKINLKDDFNTIYDFIKQRVHDYPNYINNGPGQDEDPISQITLSYEVYQSSWIALVFDTRPDGSPDGEWQSYIEENWLEIPHWLKAGDALYDNGEAIDLILPNGTKQKLGEDDDLVEPIGEMLKDVLMQARKKKCFNELPIASKSSLGIEHHDGAYGWPDYEDRYKTGWIVKK